MAAEHRQIVLALAQRAEEPLKFIGESLASFDARLAGETQPRESMVERIRRFEESRQQLDAMGVA